MTKTINQATKTTRAASMIKCSICGREIESRKANNSAPINDGKCCEMCNRTIVIPARVTFFMDRLDD